MSVEIKYNDAVIASLEAGQTATLKCANSLMTGDVVIAFASDESAGDPVPVEKIEFTIDYDDGMYYDFEAEKGMTWGEFIDSEYSKIYGDELPIDRDPSAISNNGTAIDVAGENVFYGYDLTRLVYEDDIIESMTYKSEYYNHSGGGSN